MFAKDVMKKNSVVCTEEMPLMQVYQLMQENECEFVTVVENYAHRTPIGIVTEHDICLQIIGKGRNPRGLSAANVMNTNVLKTSDTSTLEYCADLIKNSRANKLLVTDENGALCGVLTQSDIETNKNRGRVEDLHRNPFFGEFQNARINRIF